jgi:colanic acid biosynthesis glycosyl transferase WcaI
MRIAVHDFAGHPFQVQLSRELARAGHSVLHLYLQDLPGPKGPLQPAPQDPSSFLCEPVSLGAPLEKYSMWKRHFAHRKYARILADRLSAFRPDAVLSANTPIDVQHYVLGKCRQSGAAFVHWMQDLYCQAVRSVIMQRFGKCGAPLALHYDRLERRVCERSHAVVLITPDFLTAIAEKGFHSAKRHVIENWAPLDDVLPAPKWNSWSIRHNLADKLVLLYSGTLGLKHKPELLYHLAAALLGGTDAVVVVVSEGLGRAHLEQLQARSPLPNLLLMDFQPYARMSQVFGAADVLLGIIDNEAGAFAVPSKVLSYLCAGKPVLLAAPKTNLAARTVDRAEAGIVVSPDDIGGFISAARYLAASAELRGTFAGQARRYAMEAFNIRAIGAKFEAVLTEAVEEAALSRRAGRNFVPAYPRVAAD